jgi:hypothetical protein
MQTHTVSISQNTPIRLNDLPRLLAPYAQTAPIYVYMMAGGTIQTTRFRLREEADLLLVIAPRGIVC